MKNIIYLAFLFSFCSTVQAQTNLLKINPGTVLPKDSLEGEALISSLNAFLFAAQENNENNKNTWILPAENVETQVLIDEIQDIQKSKKFENESFFKPYLTNIVPLKNNKFSVKISYIGINEDMPFLRASFGLIAHKSDNGFLISSPLITNTQNWKTKKIQNHIFHYPFDFNVEKAQEFAELASFYDEKLKNTEGETHYYLCDDEVDPLQVFGVDYKSDYNGRKLNTSWVSTVDKKSLNVLNASEFYEFDQHDLWHNRLSRVISRRKVHRRVDCHIATLHGGTWGLSWEELFPMFSEKFVVGKNVDWLAHKKNSSHFLTTERNRKNYTDDFIGALLVRKIEKEKGFGGVWDLLMTKRTKEEDEYFAVLEKLTGINKKSYNKEVSKLIKEEMKNLGI